MDVGNELKELLLTSAKELGVELKGNLVEVTTYAAERAAYLSTLVGHAGFEEAAIAERDNVAIKLGVSVVRAADAADQRLLGIIQAVLTLGARAIATAA